jgi:hypothetical protein
MEVFGESKLTAAAYIKGAEMSQPIKRILQKAAVAADAELP